MKYDLLTAATFKANAIKAHIQVGQSEKMPGILLKNVELKQHTDYTMYVNIKSVNVDSTSNSNSNANMCAELCLYTNIWPSPLTLKDGINKINVKIDELNKIEIGLFLKTPTFGISFDILDIDIRETTYNNRVIETINTCFNENVGFGKYKNVAMSLLKDTIEILDKFNIDYCLISGTLLGYVRHKDFIPWDDDIDLIVDASFLDKMPDILTQQNKLQFTPSHGCKWIMKSYYDYGREERRLLDQDKSVQDNWPVQCKWTWPFIDLFIYEYDADRTNIIFFKKKWNVNKFFPIQKKSFLGLSVSVPKDPEYFLLINYGKDCMTMCQSSNFCHKKEKYVKNVVNMDLKLLKYKLI